MRLFSYDTDRNVVRPAILGRKFDPVMARVTWVRPTHWVGIQEDAFGPLARSTIFQPPHGLRQGTQDPPPNSQIMPDVSAEDSSEVRRINYAR